ncbi:MAG: hypothetical protein SF070_16810 [Gemmatimonadota bacterium]|nr:hypothetical protein [Gemmatimonadota bacterium]
MAEVSDGMVMLATVAALSGLEWVWGAVVAGGLLLAWSLTPFRAGRAQRSSGAPARRTLAIYPLLWVRRPDEVAALLKHQPGVEAVDLDLRHGQARVTFDPVLTSVARLESFVDECARHCGGTRAPDHACPTDPHET